MRNLIFEELGKMDYKSAWDVQENLLKENILIKSQLRQMEQSSAGEALTPKLAATTDHLLFVEHPPVYTLGKSGHTSNLLISEQEMNAAGIEFYQTNRGGDITFHGPGQLVGYPILDLEHFETDIGKYLRNLEEVIIRTLKIYGIAGQRSPGETGVWIDVGVNGKARKICAMGVRCSRWITMHGFALNVNTDLGYFGNIIPCGIADKAVTSMQAELGEVLLMEEVKAQVKTNFEQVFGVRLVSKVLIESGTISGKDHL